METLDGLTGYKISTKIDLKYVKLKIKKYAGASPYILLILQLNAVRYFLLPLGLEQDEGTT